MNKSCFEYNGEIPALQTDTTYAYCDRSCVTWNTELQVCMLRNQHLETDVCQYRCTEICSGETACMGLAENCSRKEINEKVNKCSKTWFFSSFTLNQNMYRPLCMFSTRLLFDYLKRTIYVSRTFGYYA